MKAPVHTLNISIIGMSGSGKSTCAATITEFAREQGLTCAVVKLAQPLYELQEHIYRVAGVSLARGAQDQVLMEQLAESLRRIRPTSLADDFVTRLAQVEADIVINDDLRDPFVDEPALRRHGFRILRVTCSEEIRRERLARRGDLSRAEGSTCALDLITPDVLLRNDGNLQEYRSTIRRLVRGWL